MRDEIKKEITEISAAVAAVGNANIYTAPEGYFSNLPDEVISRIVLPHTQTPFAQPPALYFESLAASVLQKIKAANIIVAETEAAKEIQDLSPLLAGIRTTNVYTVPANYFSSFTVNTAVLKKPLKPIQLHTPVKWIKYTAAAAIAGVIATGGILLFKNNADTAASDNQYNFTKNYNTPLSKLSNDAITNYLQGEPEDADEMQPLYDDNNSNVTNLTQDLLHDVSDNDIQQYLKDNTEPGEDDIKGI